MPVTCEKYLLHEELVYIPFDFFSVDCIPAKILFRVLSITQKKIIAPFVWFCARVTQFYIFKLNTYKML